MQFSLGGVIYDTLQRTVEILSSYATLFDYNAGCPHRSMTEKHAGTYLLDHPEELYSVITFMRSIVSCPFTVKLRLCADVETIAKQLECLGVDAVAIHPRTAKQRSKGIAHWDVARRMQKNLRIPVILSGDLQSVESITRACKDFSYVQIARGALRDPGIFAQLTKRSRELNFAETDLEVLSRHAKWRSL